MTDPGCSGQSLRGRSSCLLVCVLVLLATTALAQEVYFSPEGGARQRLVRAIQESNTTIDVAVYNFTAIELAHALVAARDRGVRVRVLLDRERLEDLGPTLQLLQRKKMPLRALGVPPDRLMHHKFAVFDGRLLATGSYNWTNSAERVNYENLVVLTDPGIVERFEKEFRRLWAQAER
ncbi:MAG TPA: phospholipase D-like domain-containing protein [Candidatus Sulfotelmatobacter sp.]|nr:phospholipase D-like domain-containing protein [Candidatus Sulfotelmatobacter sp.]